MIRSLGMSEASFARWEEARNSALDHEIKSSDLRGTFTATTKTFRLFLQSAMLGLGAYLVLQNELTPGAMIAGSILLGRALAPSNWLLANGHLSNAPKGVGQFIRIARRGPRTRADTAPYSQGRLRRNLLL